jgi:hypothetical protein
MIKILTIISLLFVLADARENPFFPSKGEKDLPTTTNEDFSASKLKRAALSLPSSARLIQKVTIEYKNLDGSLGQKSIDLNNAVDWHIPIFVSQSMGAMEKASVKKEKVSEKKYSHLFSSKYIKFYKMGNVLKIDTQDKMSRDFLLTNPYRLVLDFKRDVNLKSQTKELSKKVFKKISLGTHDGYYRAVILLDGQYKYKKLKHKHGYTINLY